MPERRFNDEWEALPEIYKSRFLEILEERGLAEGFDVLPEDQKSQVLEIVKGVIEKITGSEQLPTDPPMK